MNARPIPPIEDLRTDSPVGQQFLQAIRERDTALLVESCLNFESLESKVHIKPLGELTQVEIMALYAPQELHQNFLTPNVWLQTELGQALGLRWRGITIPTLLLTFLNPDPRVSAHSAGLLSKGKFLLTATLPNAVTEHVQGILNLLYCGWGPSKPEDKAAHARFRGALVNQQITVFQCLVNEEEQGTISKEEVTTFFQTLLFSGPRDNWNPDPIHRDPRLTAYYPRLREIATQGNGVLNEPLSKWLQEMAKAYVQSKAKQVVR